MPTLKLALPVLLLLPLLPQDPPPAAKAQDPAPTAATPTPGKMDAAMLQKLGWLAGTWTGKDGATTTEEHWQPLHGTTLLGTSQTFTDQQTVFFEFLRITLAKGTIACIAQPNGAPPTSFPLVALTATSMTFEQPGHDYPQRIHYERTEQGMTATISLRDGTKPRRFVFTRA